MKQLVNHIDNNNPPAGNLFQLMERAQSGLETALLEALSESSNIPLGRGDLKLLANLDCRTTYASELARRLNVSRQAVNRLLKNLIETNLVRLETDHARRNTKMIVITDEGAEVIRIAIDLLADFESRLKNAIGASNLKALKTSLQQDWRKLFQV
jgi:DNA-binding MarR family transcriptional regulator